MDPVTPNRAVVFLISSLVVFACLAAIVDPVVLGNVFNRLSLGISLMVVITWMPAVFRTLRNDTSSADWLIVISTVVLFIAISYRNVFSIITAYLEKSEWLTNSALSAFVPYSLTIAGLGFLIAPSIVPGATNNAWWHLGIAGLVSGLVAGVLIGRTIPF